MKKVVSFCIYEAPKEWEEIMNTNFNKYIVGLDENVNLIEQFYPDWYIYLYHNSEFDVSKVKHLKKNKKFETKLITDKSLNAMQWRFLPNDDKDVELFIVRDVDSRITEREKVSVDEWVSSGKILHIMRDHPHHHYHILGGMWGMVSQKDFSIENECINYNIKNNYEIKTQWFEKWWDMNFLRDIIYPKYIDNSFINTSYHSWEEHSNPFTVEMDDKHFIGEIFKEDNQRTNHYTLL
jgi:hypothetical protein